MMKSRIVLFLQAVLMIATVISPYLEKGHYDFSLIPFYSYKAVGLVLNFIGFVFIIAALKAMNKNFEIHPRQKESAQLVISGPFAYTRNPIYFGGALMALGWGFSFASWWALVVATILIILLLYKIRIEEYFLSNQFGLPYLEYCRSVPRFFPRVSSAI